MKIGAVFPQTEIGTDPGAIKAYAQALEDMGFDYLLAYEHVLGTDPGRFPDRRFVYTYHDQFHEPFVLFGFLAGITNRIELVTGILILPQRQTALVAKQAAEVDVLSGGRLRLGLGVGWNQVEMEALGYSFHDRGKRLDEQIQLLQALWSTPLVDFDGEFESVSTVGINPRPVHKRIPLWFGGMAEPVLRRIAQVGAGWIAPSIGPDQASHAVERIHTHLGEAGRPADACGIDIRITLARQPIDTWAEYLDGWRKLGATHVCLNTMGMGFATVDAHLAALRDFRAYRDSL